MDNDFWGYHLIIDAKQGIIDHITNPEYIGEFTKALVESINMKAYGEPQIVNFAHANPKTGGITLVQLIETSSITCHFVESTGDFYLDVFSCLHFECETVIDLVKLWFNPESMKTTFIYRQA